MILVILRISMIVVSLRILATVSGSSVMTTVTDNMMPRPTTPWLWWVRVRVRGTRCRLRLANVMLVDLTVVLVFPVFTVTFILVVVSVGVLPTLLLTTVAGRDPDNPVMVAVPLLGCSLVCMLSTLVRLVSVVVAWVPLLASTAILTLWWPSAVTILGILGCSLLCILTVLVGRLFWRMTMMATFLDLTVCIRLVSDLVLS